MPKDEKPQQGGPEVEVIDLKTNLETKFHAQWSDTLHAVWEQAYDELTESRRDGDTLECQDGTDLMPYLDRTLEQLRDQKVCHGRKLQIKGPTGGAWQR